MWKGCVATFAFETDLHLASPCKERVGIGRNLTNLQIWPNMKPIKLVWQPVSKSAILIHEHATSFIFFSRLKQKEQIVLWLLLKGSLKTAQSNSHVEIMATSMHTTLVLRDERKACLLDDRQTINICSPTNSPLWLTSLQVNQNTCPPSSNLDKILARSQFLNHIQQISLSLELLQANLWNLVQISSSLNQI